MGSFWPKILDTYKWSSEVYFYYYPWGQDKPIYILDIVKIFEIDTNAFDELESELYSCFEDIKMEFINQKQVPWTNLTFILESTGHFKIYYDYEDLSEANPFERHVIWKYENLGIQPSPEQKSAFKIFNEYISKILKFSNIR